MERSFQVLAKPAGARCNLACTYCYYLGNECGAGGRMSPEVLEAYVAQLLAASSDPVVRFSWHGGEPTMLGLEYFRAIACRQRGAGPRSGRLPTAARTRRAHRGAVCGERRQRPAAR